jgi:ADP-ribose pyrophosphatase
MTIVSRDVQFSPGADAETYYAIEQPSYVTAVALTPEGRILLVRQYRPAIERFSLELPGGLVDENEDDPVSAMVRELLEETGYSTETIDPIGNAATCSSRISNSMYSYFLRTRNARAGFCRGARCLGQFGDAERASRPNRFRRIL